MFTQVVTETTDRRKHDSQLWGKIPNDDGNHQELISWKCSARNGVYLGGEAGSWGKVMNVLMASRFRLARAPFDLMGVHNFQNYGPMVSQIGPHVR